MSDEFTIRPATVADCAVMARHRVSMFRDMATLPPDAAPALEAITIAWLKAAIPDGEYAGWLAVRAANAREVVAGAGVHVHRVLPFPLTRGDGSVDVAAGRQAVVVNVYTEPAYRRRGLARRLMETVLEWARSVRLERLVLHAAPDGRPLYESLGFVPTNEMRYQGLLEMHKRFS